MGSWPREHLPFHVYLQTLWSGWALVGPNHKVVYTGDTGFCDREFAKIGRGLGPFDLALIPIGCYSPRSRLSLAAQRPLQRVHGTAAHQRPGGGRDPQITASETLDRHPLGHV